MGLFDAIGSVLGTSNRFRPQGAEITNPFGTNQAAQQAVGAERGASAGILGQQGALAGQLIGRMNQEDPRYAALISQAMEQAAGRGPNPAQAQFQQNVNQAVQQQAGGVASVRGLNPALAARLAAQGGAGMLQGAAGQAATLQAQQQIAAQQMAGGLLGQQGALQAQFGGMGAGLLGTMGQQGLGQQQVTQAALANLNAQRVGMQTNINNVGAQVASQNAATNAGMLGGALQGAGGAMSLAGLMSRGGRVRRMADGGAAGAPAALDVPAAPVGPEAGGMSPLPSPAWASPAASPLSGAGAPIPAPSPGPKSDLGKDMGMSMREAGAAGAQAFRSFAPSGASAPYVMTPWQFGFARGGQAGAPPAVVPPVAPGPRPDAGPGQHVALIARQVAEGLARVDPRSAAVVYADLTGVPMTFTPEDVRKAYHILALNHAALLSRPAGGAVPGMVPAPAVPAAPRRRVAPPETDTVPLRRALGGRTFARDGRVPGRAEVRGDSERNDKVPAMLSPGEIVVPRSVVNSPDAPAEAARFVSHLVAKQRHGYPGRA